LRPPFFVVPSLPSLLSPVVPRYGLSAIREPIAHPTGMQTPDASSVEERGNTPVSLDTARRYKASIRGSRREVAHSGTGTKSMALLAAEK
jgi:hypothetical protein